jgi:hypothetical protein
MFMKVLPAILAVLSAFCIGASGSAATVMSSFGVSVLVLSSCQASVPEVLAGVPGNPARAAPLTVRVVCTNSSSADVRATVEIVSRPLPLAQITIVSNATQPGNLTFKSDAIPYDFREDRAAGKSAALGSGTLLSSRDWVWESSPIAKGGEIERVTITY